MSNFRMLKTVSDCMLVKGVADFDSRKYPGGFFRSWEKADMIFVGKDSYVMDGAEHPGDEKIDYVVHDVWVYTKPNILIHLAVTAETLETIEKIPMWTVHEKPYITSGDFQHSENYGEWA